MSGRAVWVVKSYDRDSGDLVEGLFTTEAAAEAFKAYRPDRYEVEEFPLFDTAPAQWTYHTAITHVYPDGTMKRGSFEEHTAEGLPSFAPLEDADLFNGHMQSHCGVHIYVCGTDKDLVRKEYRRLVSRAKREATGTCSCGRTELFQRDWMNDPKRDLERAECAKTHTGGWCSNCYSYTVRFTLPRGGA